METGVVVGGRKAHGLVGPVFFNVHWARHHLLVHGFVFTVRRPRKTTGITRGITGSRYNQQKIATVQIRHIRIINRREDLRPYWQSSGALSLDHWWLEVTKLLSEGPRALYRVHVLYLTCPACREDVYVGDFNKGLEAMWVRCHFCEATFLPKTLGEKSVQWERAEDPHPSLQDRE